MTEAQKLAADPDAKPRHRCAWCGAAFAAPTGPGRPARYCRRSHRQRAYEARRLAEARRLVPGEALVGRDDLQIVRDRLYQLEAALQDADTDLQNESPIEEVYVALRRVAALVAMTRIEPIAVLDPDQTEP